MTFDYPACRRPVGYGMVGMVVGNFRGNYIYDSILDHNFVKISLQFQKEMTMFVVSTFVFTDTFVL